ncbi:MAG: 2-amino-4-hydroxy-6-hydroxymethyldihydropteridine diphosphokinase [Candidatus Marinimicrobia bacterium]|jgi:2-amino-4-hydroxy-6-hydroxymethyldihydropteridine diphosphokinase|nr:2-amino-4-hydroxy-6-hydroxymethyldihydropteridine diphosphokinase [Candidatus Neomarinimicrobiota bacterium]MBT3634467.1 2-amino-4-hydroxy-6-hydroxymethyldihydropteridine diphosphokinase [Candidatus Neomarinimicrobiota bacterium]MBT3683293.1 2-amino-4-hydroxy-6-hydroxymethyldihydropteridine diphosphokinase [Candidatus Neomarinimicrobiota bacterium]MBT3760182.1 2-amino-4-hydroxy-6-hydroxymethyldihydropteridine diphosphokinase [Candidatus Neomarinimicrobiota bacterium]MBT3896277.1 2-amino-4-hy
MNDQVFLGLGSNLDDRLSHLLFGIDQLSNAKGIQVINISSVYISEPKYLQDQNDFLNMVIHIETEYSGQELLKIIKNIEYNAGRDFNIERNGPRKLDIDILSFQHSTISTNELQIPHPRIAERKFVLIPWSEISPQFILPGGDITIESLLAACCDTSTINIYKESVAF